MNPQDPQKPIHPAAPPAKPQVDDGFEPTLIAEEAPPPHAGSPLYQDDKKFPRWVWPVVILVLLGLWWLSR